MKIIVEDKKKTLNPLKEEELIEDTVYLSNNMKLEELKRQQEALRQNILIEKVCIATLKNPFKIQIFFIFFFRIETTPLISD